MKCVICKTGETSTKTTTVTFEKNGSTMILKDVPCERCEQCGEIYLSNEITRKLMDIVEKLSKIGGEVNIHKFVAA